MRSIPTLILLLLLSFADNIYGQSVIKEGQSLLQQRLSPAEMQSDINALVSVLEEAHPLLHYFNSQDDWYDLVDETKESIEDSLTQFEFYRKVAPIIASIHEVHTYIEPSRELAIAHQLQRPILPLELLVIESRMYVGDTFLPQGTEILSINGRSIKDIILDIRSKANPNTGVDDHFVQSTLNNSFNFAMGYSYFVEDAQTFSITYKLPSSNKVQADQVNGILNPVPEKTFPHWGEIVNPFQLKFFSDSIAYLKVRGWMKYEPLKISNRDIMKFFRTFFASIASQEVNSLIIDLRDNFGGSPRKATELLRYLIPTPFRPIEYSELETQDLISVVKVRDPKNYKIADMSLKCENGRLIVRHMGPYKKHIPRKYLFTGNIYFLVNAKCASATSLFLALADYHDLGVFIGETPGGNTEYVCGHQLLSFKLPNAELNVQIPLRKSKINTTNEGSKHGVELDYYVPNNLSDGLNKE
ncbi:MAG: S41 family peptidase [Bacteroidota bacterium]